MFCFPVPLKLSDAQMKTRCISFEKEFLFELRKSQCCLCLDSIMAKRPALFAAGNWIFKFWISHSPSLTLLFHSHRTREIPLPENARVFLRGEKERNEKTGKREGRGIFCPNRVWQSSVGYRDNAQRKICKYETILEVLPFYLFHQNFWKIKRKKLLVFMYFPCKSLWPTRTHSACHITKVSVRNAEMPNGRDDSLSKLKKKPCHLSPWSDKAEVFGEGSKGGRERGPKGNFQLADSLPLRSPVNIFRPEKHPQSIWGFLAKRSKNPSVSFPPWDFLWLLFHLLLWLLPLLTQRGKG